LIFLCRRGGGGGEGERRTNATKATAKRKEGKVEAGKKVTEVWKEGETRRFTAGSYY